MPECSVQRALRAISPYNQRDLRAGGFRGYRVHQILTAGNLLPGDFQNYVMYMNARARGCRAFRQLRHFHSPSFLQTQGFQAFRAQLLVTHAEITGGHGNLQVGGMGSRLRAGLRVRHDAKGGEHDR